MIFRESELAHALLDGLPEGIEVGGSAHNPFNIRNSRCRNVDVTDSMSLFKEEEVKLCGRYLPVDIIADGGALPIEDNSVDYVIASHMIEHTWKPLSTIEEWVRVVRPGNPGFNGQHGQPTPFGGYLFIVVPHKDRMTDERSPDRMMPPTELHELIGREAGSIVPPQDYLDGNRYAHRSFWRTEDWFMILGFLDKVTHGAVGLAALLDVDDKVGNGFTIVLQKKRVLEIR